MSLKMEPVAPPIAAAKQELAIAYREMMQTPGWKHFEKSLDHQFEQAVRDEDNLSLDNFVPTMLGECRGRRNAIRKIKRDIDFILTDLQ